MGFYHSSLKTLIHLTSDSMLHVFCTRMIIRKPIISPIPLKEPIPTQLPADDLEHERIVRPKMSTAMTPL
ncbi:hypothetical protein MMC13_004962 [Lambiella insularis]|nr:hypothetical protein [Lambiella insularis]